MAGAGSGYDNSVTTLSPDGRIFQVEYATKAADNSGTVMGLCCQNGVVLGAEKFVLSKLLKPGTNRRIHCIDRHIGCTGAGLAADVRALALKAQGIADGFRSNYDEQCPGAILTNHMGIEVHQHTLYWSSRPYGATLLMGSYEEDVPKAAAKPELYMVDPSGEAHRCRAMALGKGRIAAKNELHKIDSASTDVDEGAYQLARIIEKVHDEKDRNYELELAWIRGDGEERRFSLVPRSKIDELLGKAKAALEAEDDGDDD